MTRNRSRDTADAPPVPSAARPDLSFTAFHRMNRAGYVRYAETYLRHRQDAEEAIDSTFEHLLRTWDQVLLTENPAAFAWTIMRNKVIDHVRARTRRPPLIDEAAFDTVALRDAVDPIGQITESLALFRALRQLTDWWSTYGFVRGRLACRRRISAGRSACWARSLDGVRSPQ
ncbi:RNA polymerase sigma factor [Streptomyces halstedii]|uniref:RNA polymerase sigma factor n=1 Tax=Streptomyces halstedii TaxID=1944 RepID=UPI0033B9486C